MPDAKLGLDAGLHYSSTTITPSGSPDDVSWNLIDNVSDVDAPGDMETTEVGTRADGIGGAQIPSGITDDVSFDMIWDQNDAPLMAIRDAYFDRTELAFAVMDAPIVGDDAQDAKGRAANFYVTGFNVNQAKKEGLKANVTLSVSGEYQKYDFTTA